jgi:Xaa-Pro aminopeptidase
MAADELMVLINVAQSEYLAECDKRRAFISGFNGSAGTAIVTDEHACMWTDGRYFLQAANQMSAEWTLMKDGANFHKRLVRID